jgi:hypothetical protein
VIEARGGSVSSGYIDIAEGRATGKTLFQILFGGGEGDDEGDVVASRGKKGRTAVASRSRNTQTAALSPDSSDGNAMAFFSQANTSTSVAARQEAPALRNANARPTRPTPLPEPPKEEPKPAPPPEVKREEPKPVPTPAPQPAEQKPVEVAALQPRGVQTATDADGKRVQVQLPPRRPSNFAALVAAANNQPSLVTVPLPPQRPATLLASASVEAILPAQPTPSPITPAAPARSAALGLRTEPLPASASSFAPQPALPSGRIVPAAPAAQRPAAPTPALEAKDRKALDSLMSQVAAASAADKVAPVAPPTVSSVTSVKAMTGRFESAPQPAKDISGFTGSVIRPIGQGFR